MLQLAKPFGLAVHPGVGLDQQPFGLGRLAARQMDRLDHGDGGLDLALADQRRPFGGLGGAGLPGLEVGGERALDDPGLDRHGQADSPGHLGVAAAEPIEIHCLAGHRLLRLAPDRAGQVQAGVDHLLRRAQLRLRQLLGGLWRDRFGGVGGWLGREHNGNIEWTDPD